MIYSCIRFSQRIRPILRNFKSSASGNVNYSRKNSQFRTPVSTDTVLKPGLRLALKCGVFTVISTNAIFLGSLILGFEAWQARYSKAKSDYAIRNFISTVRDYIEKILGRPLQAFDVYWAIVVCNVLVFLALNSQFSSTLLPYFCSSPYGSTPVLSLVLSLFSHKSLFHLGINMYVLHSFASSVMSLIGVEDFFSVFIAGGIFSGYVSLMNKLVRRSSFPSLGASGGICAIIGAFSMLQPNARLCVPFIVDFIPHSFQASSAVWIILSIEIFGLIFLSRRSALDHAAHAGGLIFGIHYYVPPNALVWPRVRWARPPSRNALTRPRVYSFC
ncbi:unnamed protein product [Schistosoma intercalatum]|nr:unnamed protein product [Schistosoma intercalatum]